MKDSYFPLWIIPAIIILIPLVLIILDRMKYARKLKVDNKLRYKSHIK